MKAFSIQRMKIVIASVSILVAFAFVFSSHLQFSRTQDKDNLQVPKTRDKDNLVLRFTESDTQADNSSLKYRKLRNDLSRQLNLMMKLYGQQSCEKLSLLQRKGEQVDARVSENGGWCANTSSPDSVDHMWDQGFSTAVSKFLEGKRVASFGDGPGMYKQHIDSMGQVASYTAYDGAPFCETTTDGIVIFLDLTAPQYGLPGYDWVVSVEVGEHIPAKYEDIYLDNLVRHAREGIILSWAVPGQHGLSHVNNKPLEDVIAQMEKRGFRIDQIEGEQLRQASIFEWLKNNVNIYKRVHPDSFHEEDV